MTLNSNRGHMPQTVTFDMTRSKETKGTVVFTAVKDAPITTLYVLKGNAFSNCQTLSVTLEVAEARQL
jgi:hypothetical protein